jgi:hypothetical protein
MSSLEASTRAIDAMDWGNVSNALPTPANMVLEVYHTLDSTPYPRTIAHHRPTPRTVPNPSRWVTRKSSLGDAKSLLGDAESSLGDAKSLLGDAKSSLGDAESSGSCATPDGSRRA